MPKSREQLKQEYINSLDSFIAQNPKVGQLDTARFRDFLIGLVEHESGFNPTARQGSYFGWYQTNKLDSDPYQQHLNAFNHLNGLFRDTITKADIQKARELGIKDAALMLKYWNQGNRVNNYIWNGKDSADGLGTKISNYGNDLTMPLDVYSYAMDNLTGDYVVKSGDNWFNLQKKVRMPGRDYATGGKDLWNMQKLSGRPYGSLSIGQKFNFGEDIKTHRPLPEELLNMWRSNPIDVARQYGRIVDYVGSRQVSHKPKYAKGGLIYTPFINKEVQTNDDLYDWTDNQWYFPVEPVHVPTETTEEPTTTQSSTPTQTPVQEEVVTTPTVTPTIESTVTPGNIKIRSNHPDTGKMKNFLDFIQSKGVSLIVTSGTRPNAMTKSGNKSRHSIGEAIDVAPIDGNFDKLLETLKHPDIVKYMKDNRIRILNETSKYVMGLTGATGPHLHISINGERFGKNVWDYVIAHDDDWYTYTGKQRPILRFGGILQRGGLIYTPFMPNKQDLLWDNSIVDNEIPFPVEPVRISNPTPIQETTSKPEETVKESPVVETPVTEESAIGKIYTSKEKEQFKSDMYDAYFSELSSRGLDNNLADAFAKRLTTQDILESGWGQSSLSKYFNFGGIKDFRSNSNPVVLTTHEYENGERKTKKQPFRRFNNLSEYVKYKIDLVSKNWKVFDDIPEMYFENLVKGRLKYATSPTYADKLDRLFKSIWKTT